LIPSGMHNIAENGCVFVIRQKLKIVKPSV